MVKPTSLADAAALKHDVAYLFSEDPINSDIRAIIDAGPITLHSTLMRLGLGARTVIDVVSRLFIKRRALDLTGRTDTLGYSDRTLYKILQPNIDALLKPYNLEYRYNGV
jgi:hypothetical protein